MGQKVDPNGLRTGIIKGWNSKWYADKAHFADNIIEDNKIRKFIKKKYFDTAISKITIERAANKISVGIYSAHTAVLIGKGGAGVQQIKNEIDKLVDAKGTKRQHQHHGSATSRRGRATRRRKHRKTARSARKFPSQHETSDVKGYESGRKGRQDHGQRSSRRRRDRKKRAI